MAAETVKVLRIRSKKTCFFIPVDNENNDLKNIKSFFLNTFTVSAVRLLFVVYLRTEAASYDIGAPRLLIRFPETSYLIADESLPLQYALKKKIIALKRGNSGHLTHAAL